MSIVKLPNIVYPLQHLDKTNEIIDVVNSQLNTGYTEENPALTPVEGVVTWTVTHNLGTEDVSTTVFRGDEEVITNVTVASENAITVTFNSASNISAKTYSVVVLAKGGLIGSGGGSITVDSELSTTSTNPVQNRIITNYVKPKLDNYLPKGTTINVKLDGTGDFTSLADAIDSLEGKWSDGNVVIQLGSGTFEVTSSLSISPFKCNIPIIDIVGVSTTDTIIDNKISVQWNSFLSISNNGLVRLRNLKITGKSSKSTGGYIGISVSKTGTCELAGVITDGVDRIIETSSGGRALITGTNSFLNCHDAFFTKTGTIALNSTTSSFTNVETAFYVEGGGIIQKFEGTLSYSSVTNKTNVTANTVTSNGIIMGSFN